MTSRSRRNVNRPELARLKRELRTADETRARLMTGASEQQPAADAPVPVNGHGSAFQPDPGVLAARAVGKALIDALPQLLFQAVAQALSQVPVRTVSQQFKCARCVLNRLTWMQLNAAQAQAAEEMYKQAVAELAELPEDHPRRSVPVDASMFLPDELRPGGTKGIASIAEGVVMAEGAVWCMEHVPGAPGAPEGSRLLVANAGFSPSMLASFAA